MKKLIVVAVAIISAVFYLFAGSSTKDKISGMAGYLTNERQCFRFHRERYNDPDSAYVLNSYIWSRSDESFLPEANRTKSLKLYDSVIRVKTKAKNAMGSYRTVYIECPLVDGEFSAKESNHWESIKFINRF